MTATTYQQHQREAIIANVPATAIATLAVMVLYIGVHVLVSPDTVLPSVPAYAAQLAAPLLMWLLATGPLRRFAPEVVLACELIFTIALTSHLLLPTTDVLGVAVWLSVKMLATALLLGWDMRIQSISSGATLLAYWFMIAIGPHRLIALRGVHQMSVPAVAALLSIAGALRSERIQRQVFERSQQLTNSEANLRTLIESGPDGIIVVEGSVVTYVSPPILRLLGYRTADALIGRHLLDLVRTEDRPAVERYLADIGQGRERAVSLEARLLTIDGRELFVAVRAAVVRNGSREMIQLVLRDITERARIESEKISLLAITSALAHVGQEFLAAVDTSEVLDRMCRLSTEVLQCDISHTFLRRPDENVWSVVAGYGDPPEQWSALQQLRVPSPLIEPVVEALARDGLIQCGQQINADMGLARLQSAYDVSHGLFVALRRGEEVVGVLTAGFRRRTEPFSATDEKIARGIAQLGSLALENARLVDELERANRIKSDFVATMSHELRTPLNVIIGYNDLLIEGTWGALNREQQDSLQRVGRSARELLDLISATLDLSRLEQGRLSAETYAINLTDLMAEIDADTRAAGLNPGVRLLWRLPPELPVLHSDPTKLKVVLKNLVNNAVKFTLHGSITIGIRGVDDGVEFQVSDSGIGIDPELIDKIFDPFTQGDPSVTSRFGGVGLGLNIVRRLLELLGGRISVESTVGHGSTFRIWLPAEPSLADRAASGSG